MAVKYFENKKIPYSLKDANKGPKDITNTYCSELVWYSYYKAGKIFKVRTTMFGAVIYVEPRSLVTPYSFIDKNNVEYNGFQFIDNTW